MNFNCPLCQSVLREQVGNQMFPGDPKYGITLECGNLKCPAQEVFGHAKNANEAFEIIQQKYKFV